MLTGRRCRALGAAMVEFHGVALLAALPLCLGILQAGLLQVASQQVELAAFLAARAGAVAGGDAGRIRQVFQQALSPLLVQVEEGLTGANVGQRVMAAQAANAAALAAYVRVQVLAPGPDEAADFAISRGGRQVIPNDGLEYRTGTPGIRSGVSLQEANVLRLAATWCHPLVVPFAAELLLATLARLDPDPWHQLCYAGHRVPVRSVVHVPMQTDFRIS